MKKLIAFFYVDALNSRFLNHSIMPFLSSLVAKRYYRELGNVIGYSFAIQSCMLSGKYPEETNHWMPYFYSPRRSPMLFDAFSKIGTIFPLDKVPPLRHLMVGQVRKFFLKNGVHVNNIPLNEINKIAIYQYYYMCELPFFLELKELLQKKHETSLTYIGPPTTRRDVYSSMLKYIGSMGCEHGFIIVYDDALDGLGHRFGPYSTECSQYARCLDRALQDVHQKLRKRFKKNLTFIVFSDHSQCEYAYSLNLPIMLGKKGIKLGDDYLCFIDATLALFWPKNEVTKEKILSVLHQIKLGKVLNEDLQERYHIRFRDKRYGEIIFVLKPGGTFFPNFFSPFSAMKGLHGYLPEEEVQKSFLISDQKFLYPFRHIRDFRNFSLKAACL